MTRNGYEEFFVLSPELFGEPDMARRRQELYEAIDAAEVRLASGKGASARAALSDIRHHHGL